MRAQGRRQSFAVHTPAAAYRKDIAGREDEPCDEQEHGGWIMIATLLHHATFLPATETESLIGHAVKISTELLSEEIIQRGCALDPPGTVEPGPAGLLRLVVERMEDGECHELASTMLECMEGVMQLSELETGRLRAHRARVAWKLGQVDVAMNHYRAVDRMAGRDKYPELQVRAWIGYLTLAHLKGNFPEVRAWADKAAELSDRHGYRRLGALAHQGLMMVAGKAGDYDTALVHGWIVFQATEGDELANDGALQNLSQCLLESGHPAAARSGFAALLSRRLNTRRALASAGGLALASAALGNHREVLTLARNVVATIGRAGARYPVSVALCECATALAVIGEENESIRLRDLAVEIAETDGYHEVRFLAAGIATKAERPVRAATRTLSRGAQSVAEQVFALEARSSLEDSLTTVLG